MRERVEAWREPWSVSALAEAAGIAALGDTGYQAETRRLVPEWRAALASGLEKREGFRVYPAAANYLCARLERGGLTAAALRAALLGEGVAIRDCASFPGLGVDHVRIAVPRPEQQRILFAALDRCLCQSEGASPAPSEASPRIGWRRRRRRSNRSQPALFTNGSRGWRAGPGAGRSPRGSGSVTPSSRTPRAARRTGRGGPTARGPAGTAPCATRPVAPSPFVNNAG